MDTINNAVELAESLRNNKDNNNQEAIETFLAFVANRATDVTHKENADLIANFIDKFIVVELKRLEKPAPAQINTVKLTTIYADKLHVTDSQHGTGKTAVVKTEPVKSGLSGNGHASTKTRKLGDEEKDFIRSRFIELNGEFEDKKKYASEILETLGTDISVWQVTGFVSSLHREIAAGEMVVPDMPSYLTFLSNHRRMWARYNSIKYKDMRREKEVANKGNEIV